MKRKLIVIIIAACTGAVFTGPARADFEDTGAGARAIGMGGAVVAIADDLYAMYYNPAGLALVRTAQAGADMGKLFTGMDDHSQLMAGFAGVALPILARSVRRVTVSAGPAEGPAISTATAVRAEVRQYGTVAVGWNYFTLMDWYRESAYYFSYGRFVSSRVAAGGSVKLLTESYVIDDYLRLSPVFDYGRKNSVQTISADAGMLVALTRRLYAGLAARDINQPDVGLRVRDALPFTASAGLGWRDKGVSWGVSATNRREKWYYATGFERYVHRLFGVRGGVSFGGKQHFMVDGGFSVDMYRVQLDYTFQYPVMGIEDTAGTHRMSLLFRFGRRPAAETVAGSPEHTWARLQDDLDGARQRLLELQAEKKILENALTEATVNRVGDRARTAKAMSAGAGLVGIGTEETESVVESTSPAVAQSNPDPAPIKMAAPPSTPGERSAAVIEPDLPAVAIRQAPRPTKNTRPLHHIVRTGDNLRTLAQKYYNDETRWKEIYQANRDAVINGQVTPGQEILIP